MTSLGKGNIVDFHDAWTCMKSFVEPVKKDNAAPVRYVGRCGMHQTSLPSWRSPPRPLTRCSLLVARRCASARWAISPTVSLHWDRRCLIEVTELALPRQRSLVQRLHYGSGTVKAVCFGLF
jgi:hypothetical protein